MATAVFPVFVIYEKCNIKFYSMDETNFPVMTISPNQSMCQHTDKWKACWIINPLTVHSQNASANIQLCYKLTKSQNAGFIMLWQ